MKRLATMVLVLLAAGSLCAQSTATQVVDWGISLKRKTEWVPNYETSKFDLIGAFGAPTVMAKRLVSGPWVFDQSTFSQVFDPPAPECVPVHEDGVYSVSARAVWSVSGVGTREFSLRVKSASGVWSNLAEDRQPQLKKLSSTRQTHQTLTIIDSLEAGECVGTLVYFTGRPRINVTVTSLVIVKM